MKKGGIGGANTKTGLRFEGVRDLASVLAAMPKYSIVGTEIRHQGVAVAVLLKKKQLYTHFLLPKRVPVNDLVSSRLEPDQVVIVPDKKLATILEVKYQQVGGSVDEKLQSCDFKIRQYRKLFAPTGFEVRYAYVLNDWFLAPRYKDVLNYIAAVGCQHYFGELPLQALGLPE